MHTFVSPRIASREPMPMPPLIGNPSPNPTPTPPTSAVSHSQKIKIDDFVRYLLSNSSETPCALIANVYDEIVPHEKRFSVALEVVLPCLTSENNNSLRIAALYVLYLLYAPHHIDLNPFQSAISDIFSSERSKAEVQPSSTDVNESQVGGINLVWALWKVLQNQGADLSNLSPLQITTDPVSPEARALCLMPIASVNNAFDGISTASQPVPSGSDRALSSNVSDGYTASMSISSSESLADFTSKSGSNAQQDHEEALSRAVFLLMTARSRVLSLSEQKALKPFLATLASPLPVLKAPDLPELVSHNPTIAHPLFVYLLAAHRSEWSHYLDVLNALSPTLASFEFVGRLLQDPTLVAASDASKIMISDLVRTEGLAGFLHCCVDWIDRKERMANIEGNGQMDDSTEKAAIDLCRFYSNLVSLSLVDPSSDIESAEMAQFVLQHSNLEEATSLYRLFAMNRFN